MNKNCPDCGVGVNQFHIGGCDVERCVLCGRQLIGCHCIYKVNGFDIHEMEFTHPDIFNNGPTEEMYKLYDAEVEKYGGFLPWTGIWPGVSECQEFGWYCIFIPNKGFESVDKNYPEASEDLNRLYSGASFWSKEKRRFIKK